jgi:tetratricopeptide (TPR) repeat protein
MEDAMVYFDDAMKILDTLPETKPNQEQRVRLLVNQVLIFQLLLKFPEYYDLLVHFEPMVIGLGNQSLLGTYYTRLGHCEWWFGKFDEAIQTAEKGLKLCNDTDNIDDAAYACNLLQWCYLFKADLERVFALKREALDLQERQFSLRWYVWSLCAASLSYQYKGYWNDASREAESALKTAEEFGDRSLMCFSAWILSAVYCFKNDFPLSIEHGKYAVSTAPTPADKLWAQSILAWAYCRAGELNQGIEILVSLIPIFQSTGFIYGVVYNKVELGEGYWLDGRCAEAKQTLEEAVELGMRHGMRFYVAWAHCILGEITRIKDPDQSSAHFVKSISISKEINAENELARAYAGYGRLYKQQGNIEKAREYLTKALDIFERLGTLIEPEKVRKELLELPDA